MKGFTMGTRLALAVLAALLALPLAPVASPVEAKKRSRIVTRTYRNSQIITLADSNTSPVSATPYPSPIVVSGLKGRIRDVDVRLNDYFHSNPDDLEVLLVGPSGQTAVVMANVGGTGSADGVTLRLDDEAAAPLPDAATLQSGVFRPTNATATVIAFNAPAPSASANAALSIFDGSDPNGTWLLFVQDEFGPVGLGDFYRGWELEITAKVKGKKKRR